ncbi:Porin P [Thalassocella blandensis]|nr:Porin P [Thalassocella blandensis]
MKKPLALLAVVVTSVSLSAMAAEPLETSFDKSYLKFENKEAGYEFKFDGRIMLDTGIVDASENTGLTADTSFRRLRFAVKTRFYEDWAAEFDLDFAENSIEAKDMWLAYNGLEDWSFKVGNHKPNFSIAEMTTSRWYTFMEVPNVVEAFATGRRVGASANYTSSMLNVGVSVFGDEVNVNGSDAVEKNQGASERYGYSMRTLLRPFAMSNPDSAFHIGLNYIRHTPQSTDENEFEYDVRLENRVADYKLIRTDDFSDVDDITVSGLEMFYKRNKFTMQSEFMNTEINFLDGAEAYQADGYYVQAGYFLKGSGQPYDARDGEPGAVVPSKGESALEVALRYSTINLTDEDVEVFGGEGNLVTLGLNWYVNTNVVFRVNYIHADLDEYADGKGKFIGEDNVHMLVGRMQVMF